MLLTSGSELQRMDYSAEAWRGAPDNALGWWKSRVPQREEQRRKLAPHEVLWQLFVDLESRPDQHDLRYVIGLLLLRRRVLKLDDAASARDGGRLFLMSPKDGSRFVLDDVRLDEVAVQRIQRRLEELLFADG